MRLEIIAANLRYGDAAAPLRLRAYAQVVAKVLLDEEPGATPKLEKIRQRCRELLVTATPSREGVIAALGFLVSQNQVEEVAGGRFRLTARARKELAAQVTVQSQLTEEAVARHFPLDVEPKQLEAWFEETAVRFFSAYGDHWVAATARGRKPEVPPANVEEVAISVAQAIGLRDEAGLLAAQFREFIRSDIPEDNTLLWHFGRATFAARLMAADLAADPISSRELENALFIVDTNVLLELAVETPDVMAALNGLSRALSNLHVRLVYTGLSLDEYERTVRAWRGDTLGKLHRYGYPVVRDAGDDHVQAAIRRSCAADEHFESFYDEIASVPDRLGTLEITRLTDPELETAAEAGSADADLVERILDGAKAKRPAAARHDAALTAIGRAARARGDRCWIISTDRRMQRLAATWAGRAEAPLWMTLDTLLQVLAVEHDGSEMDATVFAPLLAQLISNDVQACRYQYELADIQTLDEIITGAEDLPAQDVQAIARRMHARRLSGAARNDAELKLEINRVYQTVRNRIGRELQEAQENERSARRRASDLEEQNRLLQSAARDRKVQDRTSALAEQIVTRARRRMQVETMIWGICTLVCGVGVFALWAWAAPGAEPRDAVALGATLTAPIVATLGIFWTRILPRYKEARAAAQGQAREAAEVEEAFGG